MYGSMEKPGRQDLAQRFQNDDDETTLVGVASAIGTGLTLTRSMFMVIAEQICDSGIWKHIYIGGPTGVLY